jgi:glycosyltransferase involved in cell wall biosynthesis
MTSPRRRARVTVVTSGHLSTCPRMLKSADALAAAGYDVRVVATCHEPWAMETDRDVRSRRTWPVEIIDYRRGYSGWTYWRSGARYHAARAVAARLGPARVPLAVAVRAFGRVHSEIVRAASAEPADLIYGGTTGALAAVAEAARRRSIPYAVDFEDLHSSEAGGPDGRLSNALAMRVEQSIVHAASFVTTSNEPIAAEYFRRYGVRPAVIHNTFPLPAQPPDFLRADPRTLRLYWFSQTIGPGRGLEMAVAAAGLAGGPMTLTLRGRPLPGYLETLRALAASRAPHLALIHHVPAPPDAMVDLARGHDVGLAIEQPDVLNRQLCLSNKAFTYILAGLAVAMTDTPGQRLLADDLGEAAALVPTFDVAALAAALARWATDPAALACAKRGAWSAARRRWHWEHDAERGTLCRLVERAVA